jgi:hypothetical protein
MDEQVVDGVADGGWPRNRGECLDGPRPCPWVRCRWHLLFDTKGSRELTDDELAERLVGMPETCALDVADRGPAEGVDIAAMLGLSRQVVTLLLKGQAGGNGGALGKLRAALTGGSRKWMRSRRRNGSPKDGPRPRLPVITA